jgi:tripartite-type tricarboxylate transporter receptor subunit TctC
MLPPALGPCLQNGIRIVGNFGGANPHAAGARVGDLARQAGFPKARTGSATDALARLLGQKLSEAQGWTVVIENIAGASGMLAAQNVARAPADGHTVFITSNTTHAANQSLFPP